MGLGYGQVLEIPGAGMIQEEGLPTVPMLTRMFRMPPTGGAQAVILNADYETMTGLEYAAYMGMEGDEYIFGELDNTVDEWYPGKIAEVTEPAIARRFRISNLMTYPVQVNAFRGEVRVYSNIDVDVQYGGPGENELQSYPTALSASYLSFYQTFLDWDTNELDDFEIYTGAVQVVAKVSAIAQMTEWIEWKRQKGYKLEFIDESMVSWNSSAIKTELQNRWNNSEYKFDWVMVVGDDQGSYSTPAGQGYGDHFYVKLDGNDELPEAGIGRVSVSTQTELLAYVNKVFFYERDPYMAETAWYKKGAVGAGSSNTGVSSIYLGRYARHAMFDLGYTQVDTAWYNDGGGSVNNRNEQSIEDGVSFFSYRGYVGTGMSTTTISNLNNYFMLPMVLTITCAEGNWTNGFSKNEAWMRAGTVNEPAGGIGSIATATSSTNTRCNNALAGGAILANMVLRDKEMGATIFQSKVNLYNGFHPWESANVASFAQWANLMGDPTVWLWTDIPQPLQVQHPASIEYGRSGYEVIVTDDMDVPVEDAWVCLYKNDVEDDTVAFGLTDAAGRIVLSSPFGAIGDAKLTVTAQNFHPYRVDVPVEVNTLMAVQNVQIIDNGQAGSQGDGDGLAEPGEIVGLWITLHNLYGINAPRVGAIFTTDDPMIEATGGVAQFGTIPGGQVRNATSLALMQIADDAQSGWIADGTIGLGIIPVGGNQPNVVQEDMFTFKIHAPEYAYVNHTVSGTIVPGATVDVDFDLANIGLSSGAVAQAELVSLDPYVIVQSGPIVLPAANTGQTVTTAGHTITAHPESFKGYPAKAELRITNAAGFMDTVRVTIPLGTRSVTDPVGPDSYGYIAFDDRDVDYDIAPEFDWVEINPNVPGFDYSGTRLNINDNAEEDDDAVLIQLPFGMQYYGNEFTEMTVCCNGFVSMGDQRNMLTPRNWHIPSPLGPNNMIAPYWDDRKIGNGGGVYAYYDQPNGRYIIEWYNVKEVSWSGNVEITFQMVIYDQVGEYITVTGDNTFLFQYEDVDHTTGDSSDNDYMTVGVENGDQTVGLQISYWDGDDGPNGTITNGRAILITTQAALITGTVTGNVTYELGGAAVEGATVRTSDWGYFTTTDANGDYVLSDVVIGVHDLVADMQGINPAIVEDIEVLEDQTTVQDFTVTSPGFETDVESIDEILPPDNSIVSTVVISNPGDGPLTWGVEIDNNGPGPVTDDAWDLDDTFPLTGNDNRHRGITLHKGFYWISGSNNFNNPNGLYRLNMDGTHAQSYPQPVDNPSAGGFYGLTTDGDYIYGVDDATLFEMHYDEVTHEISVISETPLPVELSLSRSLAYDKHNDVFWIGESFTPLYAIAREGNIVVEYNTGMSILGLSYFGEDLDGYNLYFALQADPYVDITIMKMDVTTGDTMFVTNIAANVYQFKDLHITYLWDPFFWSVIVLKDGSALNDRVEVYELAQNTAWMNLSSPGGEVPAGGNFSLNVNIASLDLPEGVYSSWLLFTNNTYIPEVYMPVTLTIDADAAIVSVDEEGVVQPLEWKFNGVYPNPFNPTASVSFSMKEAADAKAMLYNVLGQRVAVLVDGELKAGSHQLTIDGNNLASGVYFLRFQAGPMQATRKVVLLR
jgi:peptidase C25-like protein/carboxypeptidase family protein/type IX secretion system substrate protein